MNFRNPANISWSVNRVSRKAKAAAYDSCCDFLSVSYRKCSESFHKEEVEKYRRERLLTGTKWELASQNNPRCASMKPYPYRSFQWTSGDFDCDGKWPFSS